MKMRVDTVRVQQRGDCRQKHATQESPRRGPKRLRYTAARTEVWTHLRMNQINIARTISHPSVVPTLPVADPEAPKMMPLVMRPVFTERAHDYWACPVNVTSSFFPRRYVLQHMAICSNIYRFTKHSF